MVRSGSVAKMQYRIAISKLSNRDLFSNFEMMQKIAPKVGGGCSFASRSSFTKLITIHYP